MKKIFLIRHGRQNSSLCNVNVPLDSNGVRQAELAGRRLASYGIEHLYSSDLIRAKQTAETIGGFLGLEVDILPQIHEIDFGELTGLTNDEIKERFSDFNEERAEQTSDLPYPGGESGQDVINRAMPIIEKLCQESDETIAIVTHGGVIRAICAYVMQTELKNKLKISIDLENTSITQLNYDNKQDRFYLERLNDYSHIEDYPELLRNGWKASLVTS